MKNNIKNPQKYFLIVVWAIVFILFTSCEKKNISNATNKNNIDTLKGNNENSQSEIQKNYKQNINIPTGLSRLLKAYPDFLDYADSNHLYWKDGTIMLWDDGKTKSHEEKLNDPDLEDMMSQDYKAGKDWGNPPDENIEPGRIRYEPFFKKMYGNNEIEVKNNTVSLNWFGTEVLVSKINGISEKLKNIIEELEKLSNKYKKYFKRTGGTFNWRNIAGTNRLSTHSFATAIDINTEYSDYWQWSKNLKYKNKIPMDIVEIFEKYGFIWGGKWYHFDTMHFEYRPELLIN